MNLNIERIELYGMKIDELKIFTDINDINSIKNLISVLSFKIIIHDNTQYVIESDFYNEIQQNREIIQIIEITNTTIQTIEKDGTKYFAAILVLKDYLNIMKNGKKYKLKKIYVIFQEYCDGGDLFLLIPTVDQVLQIYNDIKIPLIKLHNNNKIHNDIKKENIVKCENVFKLIDYGLSCDVNKCDNEIGTSDYKPPYLNIPIEEKIDKKIIAFRKNFNTKYTQPYNDIIDFKKDEYAVALTLYLLYMRSKSHIHNATDIDINKIISNLCNPNKCVFKTSIGGNKKWQITKLTVFINGKKRSIWKKGSLFAYKHLLDRHFVYTKLNSKKYKSIVL